MNNNLLMPVILEREAEKLRQERATFNQRKHHAKRWFLLRLIMGYTAVVLLVSIMIVASYIIFNYKNFSSTVIIGATGALFVDVLSLIICVWRIVLNPNFMAKLEPATKT
jgi:cell division septal protein FtsQ